MNAPRRGMTLIEVLIAFAILLAGMMGILGVLTSALHEHKRAVNQTDAAQAGASIIAHTRMEFARGETPATDSAGSFSACDEYPGYQYNRQIKPLDPPRANTVTKGRNQEFLVRVEVRWSERGDARTTVLNTIVFRDDDGGRH